MTDSHDNEGEQPTLSLAASQEGMLTPAETPDIETYRIINKVGEGGMATVWRALQLSTQREVALKVLSAGTFGSKKARIRFEREVELTARLEHPNIARIYDSGLHRGMYYYAMELFEGEHLDKYILGRQLTQREVLKLLHMVCQAVQYAHQKGVIHRDLKPSNIVVTGDGQPHILDFGLAKAFLETDKDLAISVDGDVVGTPAYMSPEQAAGRFDSLDTRTDVYSLGVIGFTVFTNQWPYDISGSHYEVLKHIQEQDPIRPSRIIPHFDSDIETILLRALAKEPDQRYQSAGELARDMEYRLKGLPIVARSANSLYLLRKLIARHRYTSTVVALLVVIVFGFSCVSYHLYRGISKSNLKLQKTVTAFKRERSDYLFLAQQVAFTHLLDSWQQGQEQEAHAVSKYFSEGTREAEASEFLSDPRPLSDKVRDFRQKMEAQEPFFVEFVIAEHYVKDGNISDARKAYQKCLTTVSVPGKNELLKMRVNLELYQLHNKKGQGNPLQPVKERQ